MRSKRARFKPESTDWPLVSVGFAGWWRVGVASGCWGVWFGVFGRVGLGVGVWFGLLTLGLCGGVSSGWCRLAGGSGKGSQGFECGVELCCPGPAGGVSQGGCA